MLRKDATAAEAERKEEEEQHLIAKMSQRRPTVREINAWVGPDQAEKEGEKKERSIIIVVSDANSASIAPHRLRLFAQSTIL